MDLNSIVYFNPKLDPVLLKQLEKNIIYIDSV